MKKYLSFGILLFITFIVNVSASTTGTVICTNNDTSPLNVRESINGSSVGGLNCGAKVEILDTNAGSNNNCGKWYKIKSGSLTGYSCGEYIRIGTSSGGTTTNIGNSNGDNIYIKDNYAKAPSYDGTVSCYEDTGDLPLRSSPGGVSTGSAVSCGVPVKINETREGSGTCGYYYNITNMETNKRGWVCGYFVNTTKLSAKAQNYYKSNSNGDTLNNYKAKLKEAGFPDSYLTYLLEIHARHPKWKFEAENINLDFNTVVDNEAYNGRNLLQGGSVFNYNYRSMDLDTYNILTDEFKEYPTEPGWYNASKEAVAFYLDPRNYLNEKYIFAFESLKYNSQHDSSTISKILSGQTFWDSVYKKYPSNVSDDIVKATREIGISSSHIAGRIKQEISGISTSDPRLGGTFTYDGTSDSGYYNFFNIKVSGENKIVKGMLHAKSNGWNTPYKGIYGGSKFIYDDYVGVNQDTMYYEKFDVSTKNGHYVHQYMQNLAAAIQETNTTYKAYVDLGNYLEKEMTFTIPVYKNMSNYAVTSPRLGNPNNYLKDLKVNNVTVSGFSYDDYDYNITLPAGTSSINVSATKINNKATVSGTGNIAITSNSQKVNITVKAQNGKTRTYVINVSRVAASDKDIAKISDIMNNSGVKYNSNYIFGINENTNVSVLVNNVKKYNIFASVSIKDRNGNSKSGIFKTGDTVTISNSKESKKYNIIIYGDINGDGIIDKLDYLAVLRDYYGYSKLSGIYKSAGDANHDGKVDKLDYLAVLRDYYGYSKIRQQ